MADETQTDTDQNEAPKNELDVLKARAKMMGLTFSNNIGVDALRTKIAEALQADDDTSGDNDAPEDANEDEDEEVVEETPPPAPEPTPTPAPAAKAEAAPQPLGPPPVEAAPVRLTKAQQIQLERQRIMDEQLALVRVRITNMDPSKADLHGEILTVANEFIGTVRKFIPFGEATDNGFHVPKCLYDMMAEKQFLHVKVVRDKRTGVNRPVTRYMREFSLEVLEPLTQVELDRLATAQIAAGSLDEYE